MTVKPKKGIIQKIEFFAPRIFVIIATAFAFFWPETEKMRTFSIVFLSILFEAIPFMLIGSLAGGLIEEFVSRDRVVSILPSKSRYTVFIAAAIGFIFPVCECAIVPVVRRLLKKGIPFSAAIAYLLAGPIFNPLVATSTAVAYFYDWRIVLLRLGLGYFVAISVGWIMNKAIPENERLSENMQESSSGESSHNQKVEAKCCSHSECAHDEHANANNSKSGLFYRLVKAVRHAAQDFVEVGCFLVVGAFFAAVIQTLLDRQAVIEVMSGRGVSILLMMILAIALNLCSEADAFVAASFRSSVPLYGQMGFLVLGPMFDIKLFLMYFSVFSRKTAIYLAILTCGISYLYVYLASYLLPGGVL